MIVPWIGLVIWFGRDTFENQIRHTVVYGSAICEVQWKAVIEKFLNGHYRPDTSKKDNNTQWPSLRSRCIDTPCPRCR